MAVLASLLMLALAACQKEPDKSAGPLEKVTIAHSTLPHSALVHLAFSKGFFLAEGLEITAQPHEFGKLALDSVIQGKADLATTADTPFMFAIMDGKRVYTIATIATSHKDTAVIARKDLGIEKPSDLKSKKIGVPVGTSGDFFIDSFLAVRGISRKEVKLIDMKPGEMLAAVTRGDVGAVVAWHPNLTQIQSSLGDKVLTFYDETIYRDTMCLAGSQEFINKHPEAIKKVLRALVRAETFAQQNPKEFRRLESDFLKVDSALLDTMLDSFDFKITLDQSLLVSLEDQTRWALKNRLAGSTTMPNYLDFIYFDGLRSIKPAAVRIIR